jgi:pimeloyl-ACP methyl ester carboxylesterase
MSDSSLLQSAETLSVADLELEVVRRGSGRPLLLLHGFQNVDRGAPWLDMLAAGNTVIAPSHPGFGRSPRPDDFRTVYDLVQLYTLALDQLADEAISVLGLSFGGWLAAELAIKAGRRIDRLVLVDALGIKVGDRETADILDVFNTHPRDVTRASWNDPAKWAPDFDALEDDELVIRARNWEALCRYGWHPYMHNPQLKRWLGSIRCPTLVLWGAQDNIVKPSYGRAYAQLIPGARFELIANAGHHPEIEQAQVFAQHVNSFLQR